MSARRPKFTKGPATGSYNVSVASGNGSAQTILVGRVSPTSTGWRAVDNHGSVAGDFHYRSAAADALVRRAGYTTD